MINLMSKLLAVVPRKVPVPIVNPALKVTELLAGHVVAFTFLNIHEYSIHVSPKFMKLSDRQKKAILIHEGAHVVKGHLVDNAMANMSGLVSVLSQEIEADRAAADCGYAQELIDFLSVARQKNRGWRRVLNRKNWKKHDEVLSARIRELKNI